MGLLDLMANISAALPTVPRPPRRPSLYERLIWTLIVLVLYLVMANTPLYGIPIGGAQQDFLILRIVFASRRGTLMELGISPIVTAGLIMQILVGSKLINLDLSDPEQRRKFTAAQKTLAVFFAIFEATAYVLGVYTASYGLNPIQQILAITQLVIASIIVILLDELIQKGWGIGSGVSLFILAGVAESVIWGMFSLSPAPDGGYWGVIPETISAALQGDIGKVVIRQGMTPDLLGLLATLALIFILIYLEGMRVEIPVVLQRYRGIKSRIPLKFIYVTNIPVLLASILYSNILFFSQIIWARFNPTNSNPYLNWIGMFNRTTQGITPIGGLVYYLQPPRGLSDVIADPMRALIFSISLIILAIIFGLLWVELAGLNPRAQAEQMVKSGLDIPGMRRNIRILEALLAKYIYPLTLLSSIIVALIAITADILGALGTGTGLLLAVGIIYQYYMIISYERALEAYPLLRRLVGE
ncbi:MAG TPA: preprotein translocase subunit SecY [Desulfurococcales archaeon]|nr:preprotein translocase subunit SecY [Desulfurococcales archaeon]